MAYFTKLVLVLFISSHCSYGQTTRIEVKENKGTIIGTQNKTYKKTVVRKTTIVNKNTYSKAPQRMLLQEELQQMMSAIPSKDYTVKVSANGSIESQNFQLQILEALKQNGYKDLRIVQIGMSQNYFGEGRFLIRPGSYGTEKWIEIRVNPQE